MTSELAALKSRMSWQHGHHIDTLPIEPAPLLNRHPVIVAGLSWIEQRIQKLEWLAQDFPQLVQDF